MKSLVPFFALLLYYTAVAAAALPPATVKVGIIMDLTTPVGRGSLAALSVALSDFHASHPDSAARIVLLPRHTPRSDAVDAVTAALDLLSNDEVGAILGPQTSESAAFVADLGARARVPVLSFSATSPSISPALAPFFIRAAPSDAAMGPAIAALACAFSWRRIVPIYEDSDFGSSLLPNFINSLSATGDTRIPYRCPIPPDASDDRISEEMYRLKTLQTRVFVLHAPTVLATRILSAATAAGMTEQGYAWIFTSAVAGQLGFINPSIVLDSMQGAIGVRPFIQRTKRVRHFEHRWRIEFLKQNPNITADIAANELSPFVYYAYDALWAVAMAADTVVRENPALLRSRPASNRSAVPAEISRIGVSEIGPELLKAIRETEFDGISGRFSLVEDELNVSVLQIENVNGETARGIGFWTPARGLSRNLKSSGGGGYSVERGDLGPVIWPGESMAQPKGWETPTSGDKLRIAVPGPVEPGFQSFLSMDMNPDTGEVVVGGYVIEVFEAAVRRLPYALPFEYVSWKNSSGKSAGDYNALVKAVSDKMFDGVVGDVTITGNRSENADFTFPYTVSGVSMVVPIRDSRSDQAWVFLKPLTFDLWLVTGAFFFLTGAVVWVLEHRVNPEFRGPPAHQLGTVFYFTFSTLVFAHKEKMRSNLSRLLMVIWLFVVLILTTSYTASLASMLTVQQFQPTITNIQELIATRKPVGYLRHSFVKGLLVKVGFDESQLKPYRSPQEYKDALSNGSVAAIIDEIPYLKVFLKYFCDNFTMGPQLYKTSGFGFAFPKGSSIVTDLSRAILNLTESAEMLEIERNWFGDLAACPNPGSSSLSSSNSLDFTSFYGLFLITGTASALALLIYTFSFCYRYRSSLAGIGGREKTLRRRMTSVATLYDEKDLSFHTFKKSAGAAVDARLHTSTGASPLSDASGSQSPVSTSLGTETPPWLELASPPANALAAIDEHVYFVSPARN